jgi:hypothetical protein
MKTKIEQTKESKKERKETETEKIYVYKYV